MYEIRGGDLDAPEVKALLAEHLRDMHSISPPESVHALPLDGLRAPQITFWTVWSGGTLVGCGALKELGPREGEIKAMRTIKSHRRTGVARAMLEHILREASKRSYHRLSLETGSQPEFEPARQLYEQYGFTYCPPFGEYRDDPNSVFLTRVMTQG
ncbi:MAG TPA: GNAT family N-acetyltransferase [Burkholderiales bacterium]|nr:GNAT family N-acetyltransferase [Burkholderiales bacterium]